MTPNAKFLKSLSGVTIKQDTAQKISQQRHNRRSIRTIPEERELSDINDTQTTTLLQKS